MKPIIYIEPNELPSFVEEWAEKYNDPLECVYERYIQRELNEESMIGLYAWKSSGTRFKRETVTNNYVKFIDSYKEYPPTKDCLEKRYLSADKKGGPIWNIFFLHVLSKNNFFNKNLSCEYPIFDQHAYRAMYFMQTEERGELPKNSSESAKKRRIVYSEYEEYRKFYNYIEERVRPHLDKIGDPYGRKIDQALFAFGKSLIKKTTK